MPFVVVNLLKIRSLCPVEISDDAVIRLVGIGGFPQVGFLSGIIVLSAPIHRERLDNLKFYFDAAAEAGYSDGFTMDFPLSADNPLARGRFAVYGYDTCFTINQKLTGGTFYKVEKMKAGFTNRLSHGTGLYRCLSGRRSR